MSIEQRVQIAAQQDAIADNLRLGTRVILDMRGFERFVDVATRDGASTGIGLKELIAKTLLADSLATQRITYPSSSLAGAPVNSAATGASFI